MTRKPGDLARVEAELGRTCQEKAHDGYRRSSRQLRFGAVNFIRCRPAVTNACLVAELGNPLNYGSWASADAGIVSVLELTGTF